jgi:proteasome accessory factor C
MKTSLGLLNMVPYFQANPRVSYTEAAADLGVTRKQLQADINQLWMCGLPGYGPGDLIDFEFDEDTIKVTFTAGMDKPLRLNSSEASGLLVAVQPLPDNAARSLRSLTARALDAADRLGGHEPARAQPPGGRRAAA